MNESQEKAVESFRSWRAGIARIHNRSVSPIEIFEDEGSVFIETDGYAWVVDEQGNLDTIS